MGRIDILVSNPAFSRRAPFLEFSPELWAKTLEGTLSAGFHMSQLIARHMVARGGGGKIVFISSLHARVPFVNSVAYNAAKRGVIAMAETIAAELLPHRINVNSIEPGWIDTPGERETFGDAAVASGGEAFPGGGWVAFTTSGKRRCSCVPTTPTMSQGHRCWLTAACGSRERFPWRHRLGGDGDRCGA